MLALAFRFVFENLTDKKKPAPPKQPNNNKLLLAKKEESIFRSWHSPTNIEQQDYQKIAEKVAKLCQKHPNLTLVYCGNGIYKTADDVKAYIQDYHGQLIVRVNSKEYTFKGFAHMLIKECEETFNKSESSNGSSPLQK